MRTAAVKWVLGSLNNLNEREKKFKCVPLKTGLCSGSGSDVGYIIVSHSWSVKEWSFFFFFF